MTPERRLRATELLGSNNLVFIQLTPNQLFVLSSDKPDAFVRFDEIDGKEICGVLSVFSSGVLTLSFIGEGHWNTKSHAIESSSEVYKSYARVYSQLLLAMARR